MILDDLHDRARAADLDAFLDELTRARDAAMADLECSVCGAYSTGLTDGECDDCWDAAERAYERRQDV